MLANCVGVLVEWTSQPGTAKRLAGSNHNDNRRKIVMATQSYRERMKAARAEARAKREAEKAEWHRRIELRT